ncbi:diguanylate cyclase [bacterium]|nr:diguanylate cyclase [bacterium]
MTEKLLSELNQYRSLIADLPVGIYKMAQDGTIIELNPAVCELLGYSSKEELLGKNFNDFFKNASARKKQLDKIEKTDKHFDEFKLKCKDDSEIWVRDYLKKIIDDQSEDINYEGVLVDITKQKNFKSEIFRRGIILEGVSYAAQQLLKSSSWVTSISSILEQLGYSTGVSRVYIHHYYIDEETGEIEDENYYWLHPIFEMMLEKPELEQFPLMINKPDGWDAKLHDGELIYGNTKAFSDIEQEILAKNEILSIMCVPIFVSGKYWGFIGLDNNSREREWTDLEVEALKTATNIIGAAVERKDLLDKLERIAVTDELTELLNRRGFMLLGEQQIKLGVRAQQPLALIFIDMDGLKWINDNLGHEEGDLAICDMADLLRLTFRDSDVIGRIGGDEFVAMLNVNREQTEKILLARLKGNINDFNAKKLRKFKVSASIGVSYFDIEAGLSNIDEMLRHADDLMFEDKKKKKAKRGQKPF